ncbi:MAG: hypothetical protein L6V88_07090 [Anaerotruncus sp.]|nr:MAG: hypothetical protein L6V88_07090 [Anaerotruncus sp.]
MSDLLVSLAMSKTNDDHHIDELTLINDNSSIKRNNYRKINYNLKVRYIMGIFSKKKTIKTNFFTKNIKITEKN